MAYEVKQPLGQEMSCTQGWHRSQAGAQAGGMRCAVCIRVSAQSVPPELSMRLQVMGEERGAVAGKHKVLSALRQRPAGSDPKRLKQMPAAGVCCGIRSVLPSCGRRQVVADDRVEPTQ